MEVLVCTARVRELIEDPERTKEIVNAIEDGHHSYGMQTFDQSLMQLLRAGLVTQDEAIKQASNRDDFLLKLSGIDTSADAKWDAFGGGENVASPQPSEQKTEIPIERF